MMALYPLEALRLLAGPQWDAAAQMVSLFSVSGIFLGFNTFVPNLIMAMGRADLTMRAEVSASVVRVVLVVGSAFIFRDMMAVAIAYAVANVLTVPVFYFFKNQCVPIDWRLMVRHYSRSAQVALICLAVPMAMSIHYGLGRSAPMPFLPFGLVCLATVLTWLAALRLCNHDLAREPMYRQLMARLGWPDRA
jgi:lipopolysaccharide exporter